MLRNILPGMGNTGNLMSPLIPFNMIIDTDVGLLSLIYKSFMDPRIFNKDFFFGKTVNQLVKELYYRKKENPLHLCINEEYVDSCDNLYNQFMEQHYDRILNMSVITEFYRLVGLFMEDSDIKLTIVCEKEKEIELLRKQENTKACNIILADTLNPKTIQSFKQFYFKSIADATAYTKHMKDKTIYFANYAFNKNEEGRISSHPLIPLLLENNVVNLIDIYKFNDEKGDNEDGD